jgi:predicted acetyltransferase
MNLIVEVIDPTLPAANWITEKFPTYLDSLATFGMKNYQRDHHGSWSPDFRKKWFTSDNVTLAIIRDNGEPVGFSFISHAPFPDVSRDSEHRISEFFIVPPRQRMNLGTAAAHQLIAQFPGKWELSVLQSNTPAVRFWRAITSKFNDTPPEVIDGGRILRFRFKTSRA